MTDNPQKPSFWQIMLSAIAAAFGVQTKNNQERDFKHGNIYNYIAAGIIFTLLFIAVIAILVQTVLNSNGL